MRRYIRHPSSMPLDYRLSGGWSGVQQLRNVSAGGVCFAAGLPMEQGMSIRVSIHMGGKDFEADGEVAWCHGTSDHHEIGVRFHKAASMETVHMVEQLCYIEQYRQQVRHNEGRELSSEQAAQEWVERYATELPGQSG
jgi:hypothetical protein